MKKNLLLLIFAITASFLQAQNNDMYSIIHHGQQGQFYDNRGLMQQRDGDFITNSYVFDDLGNGNGIPLGHILYKISPNTFTITDSLFIIDTVMASFCSPEQNPNGEGNILTNFKYHEDCDSCFLHIYHFTDNNITPIEDVVVPVCEGYAAGQVSLVDRRGDLIVQYSKETDPVHFSAYAARFGMDGTLKHQAILCENETDIAGQLHILTESPLKYYQWGSMVSNERYDNLVVYTLDSLFQRNPIIINSKISAAHEYFRVTYDTEVIPVGGNDILVAAEYVFEVNPSNPQEDELGVVVVKYDLRTMQMKGYITFNDYPTIYKPAKCLGIKMMTDRTVYFLYTEEGYPEESFVAVKMDTDLNVEWKRFCKTDNIILHLLQHPVVCKDEQGEEKGIAWTGNGRIDNQFNSFFFFCLNHDGTVGTNESGIIVRPYAFYPNPVKDQLLMQFSPDVQPKQIELYDLQGRLVHSQSKAFESIDMSQLPAGTYTMRVTMEDGKAYSDKVVKE